MKTDWFTPKKIKEKKVKIPREEKITRTFHIKLRFLTYLEENKIGLDEYGNVNINKGINILLQNGIANLERIKIEAQKKITEDFEKGK